MPLRRFAGWVVLLPTLAACSGHALEPTDGGPSAKEGPRVVADGGDAPEEGPRPPPLEVPTQHRAVATTCPNDRPEPMCMHFAPGQAPGRPCTADSECASGHNGRCGASSPNDGACDACSYDACFSDADCAGSGPCDCRNGFTGANVCSAGNCRVDADCGSGGYCSPSTDRCPGYPEAETAAVGYFCRTPKDTCVEDAECIAAGAGQCRYDATAAHWRCIDFPGCPA